MYSRDSIEALGESIAHYPREKLERERRVLLLRLGMAHELEF